jgi:hypothetical protein
LLHKTRGDIAWSKEMHHELKQFWTLVSCHDLG